MIDGNKKTNLQNRKDITIQDYTNMEGCSPNIKNETNIDCCFKDYSNFKNPQPDTQIENKNYSNNIIYTSIGNKKTDDETNHNYEGSDDENNPNNLKKQNLRDIANNNISETNQPENNEEDFINNLAILKIKATSKKETECLKDNNGFNKKLVSSKSTPIFKVIYDDKHNCSFNISDVIKDESDGVLFFISLGIDFIHNKGRLPNNLKIMGVKGDHGNKDYDDGIKVVLNSCKEKIHAFINQLCSKDQIGIKIPPLNIKKQRGSKNEDYRLFFDKKLKNIYSDSIPRNLGKILNEERKKKGDKFVYGRNKPIITSAIVREGANKDIEKKILYTLFNEVSYGDMLNAYFDNTIKELKKDNISIDLENFERYEDCSKDLGEKTKKEMKEKIIAIKDNTEIGLRKIEKKKRFKLKK